jgi:hypothetical protein
MGFAEEEDIAVLHAQIVPAGATEAMTDKAAGSRALATRA